MPFTYKPKSETQIRNDFNRRKNEGKNGFLHFEEYCQWYYSLDKVCHYCGLTEQESQQIVMTGLLNSKRFPQSGKIGRGQSRGIWLEVDRISPNGFYSSDNCVLCCYFCNNDKVMSFRELSTPISFKIGQAIYGDY